MELEKGSSSIHSSGTSTKKCEEPEFTSSDNNNCIYVDWEGPTDPENPRNWPKSRKWTISSFGFIFLTLVGIANTEYAIAQPFLEEALGVSHFVGTLGIVTFTVSFGVAPLILAPLSELFGRLPVYIVSAWIFWIMILPQALAQNIENILITRLVSGIGASTSVAIVGGMLADMWDTDERGLPMAIFSLIAFAGAGLGPVCLGYVVLVLGFRVVNWIIFGLAGICTFGMMLVSRETRASVLLVRKAKRLRKETGSDIYYAKAEDERASIGRMIKISLVRPLMMLLTEPVLFLYALWITYAWGIFYLMLEANPLVFSELYHFNAGEIGLIFSGQIIGPIIGLIANVWFDRSYRRNVAEKGPEARLYIALASGIALPIGCWAYTWTSSPNINWVVPFLTLCWIYAAMFGIYLASFNYVTDSYTVYASSALGGQSAARLGVSAFFSLVAIPMYDNLSIHMAGTILSALSTVFAVTPFLLYRYGATLRANSKFAKKLAALESEKNSRTR